jgi:hypothetical protein
MVGQSASYLAAKSGDLMVEKSVLLKANWMDVAKAALKACNWVVELGHYSVH